MSAPRVPALADVVADLLAARARIADLEQREQQAAAALADYRTALEKAVSALDVMMGDTDIDGDDSPEFLACQQGNILLARPLPDALAERDRRTAERVREACAKVCERAVDEERECNRREREGWSWTDACADSIRALDLSALLAEGGDRG